MDPKGGQTNNSPVARLITLNLLLAAVKMRFWQNGGQTHNLQKGQKVDKLITLQHIYIYGFGAVCRRKKCHFYRFFPSFIVKNGQKEMLQICPVSVCSRSIEITQNWLETAVPSLFFKKSDWDCSFRPFYWFILGFNVKFAELFGTKKALNCRNVKHVKLYLSKKY